MDALLFCGIVVILSFALFRFVTFGLLGVCVLLPFGDSFTAVAAWLTLIVGDGASGIAGLLWGTRRLPWNEHKSVIGSAAFVFAACVALLVFAMAAGELRFLPAIGVASLTAVVSGVIESVPIPVNDNLSVVIASGVAVWLARLPFR